MLAEPARCGTQANEDQNKVKDKRKDEKEKEQVTSKVLLASKKIFPK